MSVDVERLQKRALEIANRYDDYNRMNNQNRWDFQDYVAGLVGDVGDLSKLAMAAANKREIKGDVIRDIEHELNDILWSVLVLYYLHDRTDVTTSFMKAMEELEQKLQNKQNHP